MITGLCHLVSPSNPGIKLIQVMSFPGINDGYLEVFFFTIKCKHIPRVTSEERIMRHFNLQMPRDTLRTKCGYVTKKIILCDSVSLSGRITARYYQSV